jgi:transposase
MRPTMRTVAVKTSNQQARAMLFRTRDLLVGQRTQMVNALRGHLAEHGVIVGKGLGNVERLAVLFASNDLPELVQRMSRLYLSQIAQLHEEIDQIDRLVAAEAKQSDVVRRLQKVPGIGPICAMAITAFAPSMEQFRSGRDFAAWLGLVPRQHSSGGKQKLGRVSRRGP